MPSRRRIRRSSLSVKNRLKQRKKGHQKPRLIRRYIREKPRPFGYGPHDVVGADKKSPVQQPAEVTSVPNPIPDTGISFSDPIPAGSPLLGAISDTPTFDFTVPSTPAPTLPLSKSIPDAFSALPPLPSLIASDKSAILEHTRALASSLVYPPVETNPPKTPNVDSQTTPPKAHTINLAVIILLAVGSAFLLLGSCVLIKICTRTRRPNRPKPSLPIFDDADPENDFFETKESPIFGGKERLSPMPGPDAAGGPTWTWVQYPHASVTRPVTTMQSDTNTGHLPTSQTAQRELIHTSPNEPLPVASATSLHSLRRQSRGAIPMYSPRSYANIGQAITHDRHEMAFTGTADENDVSKSKHNLKRRSHLGRDDRQIQRESATSTIGLAYDGDDIGSPSVVEYTPVDKTPLTGHYEGREKIKSGYFETGTYPRVSNMPGTTYSIATATRVNVGQRNSFTRDKFALHNSSSKRQKDAQALTYALGLATPETNYMAQSPQATLYPDDSMSVVDIMRQKKRNPSERMAVESVRDIPVIVPEDNLQQNSGLMAMDFRVSQMSLSQLTMGTTQEEGRLSPTEDSPELNHRNNFKLESHSSSHRRESPQNVDMPPRVPSPPPLPSLAQMALAQHNSDAYANYRSPTYSLYGLYENPRKSIIR